MLTSDEPVDRRILQEADTLRQAGWEVYVVTPAAGEGMTSVGMLRGPAFRLYRRVRDSLPFGSWLLNRLRPLIWLVLGGPERHYLALFRTAIRHCEADMVVAHDLPMLPVAAAIADRTGAKIVYDSHELWVEQGFSSLEHRLWSDLERRLIGRCAAVITVNTGIAEELQRRYRLPSVHVVHNGCPAVDFPAKPRLLHESLGLPPDHRIVLYQGGLSFGRNLGNLVRSWTLLRDRNLHLVLLGDGPLGRYLGIVARMWRLSGRVHVLAAVPQERLAEYTASADIGIVPYRANCLNNELCTPNKLFEYVAAGIPVLASDLPEIRRIAGSIGTVELADLGAWTTMGAAVGQLASRFERKRPARAKLRAAAAELAWDRQGRHLSKIFRALIPKRS